MKKALVATFVVLGFAAVSLSAPAVYYVETWGSDDANWQESGAGTLSHDPAVGNPAGSLQTAFAAQGGPAVPETSRVYADDAFGSSGGNLTGDYQQLKDETAEGNWVVRFDFYAEDYVPSSLDFYFYSDTSGNEWTLSLTAPGATDTWTPYGLLMSHSTSWSLNGGPAGSSAQFAADLSDVDRIGFEVLRNASVAAQEFNVDNFSINFLIPEPETYLAIGFALLALGMAFRKKLNESLQTAKAALRG
jgi:hypothetical protein